MYRSLLRGFLNEIESDRISKLCAAADSDEKLFWKLLKGQRCSSQMSAFLVAGKMITDKGEIHDMWADHFEALGTPLAGIGFDDPESPTVFKKYLRSVFKIHQVC